MLVSPESMPHLFPTPDQTIGGVGRALRDGRTTAVQILESCFDRIDHWEPRVHAWVVLDRDRALDQARRLDNELNNGNDRGPLHGIPIGIKDIIDVAGLPTACGSKRWANQVADTDASVVANLRKAGAIIMGKTVTTPYAWIDPPVTRNPWNLDRTPGGSSSGSAAAVACGMCLGAIGTQTGGSITRPASFCGVAGMKPDKLTLDRVGIKPFAPSLDHVGPFARTVDDLRLLFNAMQPPDLKMKSDIPSSHQTPPRLGRLHGFFDRRADPAVRSAVDQAVRVLAARGTEIVECDDPVDFEKIVRDHRTVMATEAAGVHSEWLDEFPNDYPPRIRDLILEGRSLPAVEYFHARQRMDTTHNTLLTALKEKEREFWITPAAISTAPDPSTTGDPAFNSPWSYTGLPTVSFPIGLASDGLPVAIQLIGWWRRDEALLEAAAWCEQAIQSGDSERRVP
jgi:Asp-tRNA(Asn)/Glu-tRNA(Gln) amidotransferase A subunit family amidase